MDNWCPELFVFHGCCCCAASLGSSPVCPRLPPIFVVLNSHTHTCVLSQRSVCDNHPLLRSNPALPEHLRKVFNTRRADPRSLAQRKYVDARLRECRVYSSTGQARFCLGFAQGLRVINMKGSVYFKCIDEAPCNVRAILREPTGTEKFVHTSSALTRCHTHRPHRSF